MSAQNLGVVFKQKEALVRKIENLADFCGMSRRRLPNTLMLKIISNIACEKRVMYTLNNHEIVAESKFDSYYRQKSTFATTKILDHVRTALSANNLKATINTEVSSDCGRYDAIVALDRLGETDALDNSRVRIEIKASLGLDLEQIGRYLWDHSTLILVRVITGQVARIDPAELHSYVTFSLNALNSKIDRLLSQNCIAVPGMDCTGCSHNSCDYWKGKSNKKGAIVTLPDAEFGNDLSLFFQNIGYVAERTALMVVEELKGFSSIRKQTEEAIYRRKLSQLLPQKT